MYVPDNLLKLKELNNCDICILGLVNNCNCELCYLPQEIIRKKTGYSLKTISNSMKNLVKLGFLDYEVIPNKRYKLIRTTDLFFKYFKKRASIKKSYKDYKKKEKAPIFKKAPIDNTLSQEERKLAERLSKELLNK